MTEPAWIKEVEDAAKHAADAVPAWLRDPQQAERLGSTDLRFQEPA